MSVLIQSLVSACDNGNKVLDTLQDHQAATHCCLNICNIVAGQMPYYKVALHMSTNNVTCARSKLGELAIRAHSSLCERLHHDVARELRRQLGVLLETLKTIQYASNSGLSPTELLLHVGLCDAFCEQIEQGENEDMQFIGWLGRSPYPAHILVSSRKILVSAGALADDSGGLEYAWKHILTQLLSIGFRNG